MKHWLSVGFLGSIWAGVVFNLGIIGAFPREDVERWAEYQVQEASQGEYLIDLSGTQFLGLGGASTTLSLFKGERTRKRGRFSKTKTSGTQAPPVHSFTIDDAHFRPGHLDGHPTDATSIAVLRDLLRFWCAIL